MSKCSKSAPVLLQKCFNDALILLQKCSKSAIKVLQFCSKSAPSAKNNEKHRHAVDVYKPRSSVSIIAC